MRNFRGCIVILVITFLYLPHYSFNALTHTTSSSARGIFINKVMLGFIDFSHLLRKFQLHYVSKIITKAKLTGRMNIDLANLG